MVMSSLFALDGFGARSLSPSRRTTPFASLVLMPPPEPPPPPDPPQPPDPTDSLPEQSCSSLVASSSRSYLPSTALCSLFCQTLSQVCAVARSECLLLRYAYASSLLFPQFSKSCWSVRASMENGLTGCRCGETETIVHLLFNCPFARKVWSLAPTTPGLPCDLLQDVRSGFVRAKQQTGLPPTGLGSCRTPFPQIWTSDPTSASLMPFVGRDPFSSPSSSFLKERTIVHRLFNCPFARKAWSLAPTTLGLPGDLLQDVRSGFVRAKQQTGLPPTGLGSCRTPFPQIWISDPTSASLRPFAGRVPFSSPSSSFLKERTISNELYSDLIWSLYSCVCVARSSPVCEVCCSETSVSIIFKGSSNWCLVAFGIVAERLIVFSGLVAKAISNNRPLLVCIVSHGTFSLPASHVVKDRGLCDDFVCLRIGTVCLYLFIYCSYAFSLALVAKLLLFLTALNVMFVTNSSRFGE